MKVFEAKKEISFRGDIWLNRIDTLKKIYFNDSIDPSKRLKAFNLARILSQRILYLINYSNLLDSFISTDYKKGGVYSD